MAPSEIWHMLYTKKECNINASILLLREIRVACRQAYLIGTGLIVAAFCAVAFAVSGFGASGRETGTLISLQFIANNWPSTPFRWLRRRCWTAVLWSTNDHHIPTESMGNKLMALDETRGFPKTGFQLCARQNSEYHLSLAVR